MFLSRVEINPRRRETLRALASPHILHAALESAFPTLDDKSDPAGRHLLWRLDRLAKGGHAALHLLVQSPRRPDFTSVIEQFGWPDAEQRGETRDYAPFLSRLRQGQRWRFRLRANPVRRTGGAKADGSWAKDKGGRRGDVTAHVTVDWQKRWLTDRLDTLGIGIVRADGGVSGGTRELERDRQPDFDALSLVVVDRETVHFRRTARSPAAQVTIAMATFEGLLEVTDPALLAESMRKGIGRAKAYGCGLLTLAD